MIERVTAWCLVLILVVSLALSSWMVISAAMNFSEFATYWAPVLTALVTWIVKKNG